jgi:hypothetical protein
VGHRFRYDRTAAPDSSVHHARIEANDDAVHLFAVPVAGVHEHHLRRLVAAAPSERRRAEV